MTKRKTTEEFIEDAKNIHGDRYDYSLVDYKNNATKVKIICSIHGEFEQKTNTHLKSGCRLCFFDSLKNNTINFIKRAKEIHGDKYDYSLVDYKTAIINIKIICSKHGVFEQKPYIHLKGCNCPECFIESKRNNTIDFIKKANEIHNNKYDYSLVDYKTAHKKVKIICKDHGIFEITPHNHNHEKGCPKCKKSKNEIFIENYLSENNINYVAQKRFDKCKHKKKLPFDFYLPDYNICIEYDGQQHYNSISCWGGDKVFIETKIRDEIKNEYCKNNNIRLIRIKFDENILEKLNQYINSK